MLILRLLLLSSLVLSLLDGGGAMDPNGSATAIEVGSAIDPDGARACYSACVDPNG